MAKFITPEELEELTENFYNLFKKFDFTTAMSTIAVILEHVCANNNVDVKSFVKDFAEHIKNVKEKEFEEINDKDIIYPTINNLRFALMRGCEMLNNQSFGIATLVITTVMERICINNEVSFCDFMQDFAITVAEVNDNLGPVEAI